MIKTGRRVREKDILSEESPGPDRRDDKLDKKTDKRESKVDLINAKANKAMAVAQKRKWLVILIGVAIAAYYAIKNGAGSGLFDMLKSKLGGG
jgi:hypothetical protein